MNRSIFLTFTQATRCPQHLNKKYLLQYKPITTSILQARGMADTYKEKLRRKEIENTSYTKYFKKSRQYAAANYKEWRYPRGLNNRAVDASCSIHVYDQTIREEKRLKQMLKQPRKEIGHTLSMMRYYRQIKKHVPNFHRQRFPPQAHDIYVETHNLLNTENWTMVKKKETQEKLYQLVTEHAYPEMIEGLEGKTLKWKFIESIEAPRVTQMLVAPLIEENNLFAQVTVRFHSKQTLAVYDRYGRLMYGAPDSPRNVLDYVVFERHLVNPYGVWRIHGKVPTDVYEKEPIVQTKAIIQPHELVKEATEWRTEEKKINPYIYYPQRHIVLEIYEKLKRIRQGQRYHRRKVKRRMIKRKYAPFLKIKGKVQKKVRIKKEKILKMREEGKLPYPPKERDE